VSATEPRFIWGGRLLCPATGLDTQATLVLENGRVAAIQAHAERPDGHVIDATGCVVAPGFVDLHCDLAAPGHLHREGLASGTAAAVHGGFTTLCLSPATDPVMETPEAVAGVVAQGAALGRVRLRPVGALTAGLEGQRLTEMFALRAAGAVAVGDGGRAIRDTGLLRRALEYARAADLPVCLFPEDRDLKGKGVMHEGPVATRLGLAGIPAAAEALAVTRALLLAELTGARVHVGPVSTAQAVARLAEAQARGLAVTAVVTAAHLHLTDEAIAEGFDPNLRVRPPLRPLTDVLALRAAVAAGVVQAIASGHEPRSPAEKSEAFAEAATGMAGLETALGLVLELVQQGVLDLPTALARLSMGPARALGLPAEGLAVGSVADLVVFDPTARVRVDGLLSRARNTPFLGRALPGRVHHTLVGGRVVFGWETGPC